MAELHTAAVPAELAPLAMMLESAAVTYMDDAAGLASPEVSVISLASLMLVMGGWMERERPAVAERWREFQTTLAPGMIDQLVAAFETVLPPEDLVDPTL